MYPHVACGRCRAGRTQPAQQARSAIDHYGEHEKYKPQLDQGAEVEVSCRFRELIGDDGGDGISRRKKRGRNLRSIADDHRNRHGFAQCPAQGEKTTADDARPRVRQNHLPDHLPARGAQGERGGALRTGHGSANVVTYRRHIGHDHDGQDDSGGQQARAARVRTPQPGNRFLQQG